MRNSRYFFRYKIGVSKAVGNRRKQVDKSMRGKVTVIFSAPVIGAYQLEALLHFLYNPLKTKMHGSGKTEWFFFVYPLTPMLIITVVSILQLLVIVLFMAFVIFGLNFFLK